MEEIGPLKKQKTKNNENKTEVQLKTVNFSKGLSRGGPCVM